jgi:hypothetical protein
VRFLWSSLSGRQSPPPVLVSYRAGRVEALVPVAGAALSRCNEGVMKRLIGTTLLMGLLPLLAAAQGTDYSKGHGYVYFAPGAMVQTACGECDRLATAHIGGGGEGFLTRNLGFGADLGYLTPMRSWGRWDWDILAQRRRSSSCRGRRQS